MHKVSVIVPVYNVEKYVDICIKSIIHQTYKDLEIILVDDGSKDRSGDICDRFAKKDSRIKVIHQTNSGVSRARNNGLACATGEYVCFVDSDDWLPKDSVEILCKEMNENDVDYVNGNVEFVYQTKNIIKKYCNAVVNVIDKKKLSYYCISKPEWGACARLFKRKIIENNNIVFCEDIKSGEDTLFVLGYLKLCEKVASTNNVVYFYNRTVQNSATRTYFYEYNKWVFRIIEAYDNLFSSCKKDSVDAAMSIISCWYMRKIIQNYSIIWSNNKAESKEKINEAFDYIKQYIPSEGLSIYEGEPRCIPQVIRIIDILQKKGVCDELYDLISTSDRNNKTPIYQLKKMIKRILAWIKIEYYRLTV